MRNCLVCIAFMLFLLMLAGRAFSAEYLCNNCTECSTLIQSAASGDTVRLTASISYYNDSCILFGGKDNVVFDCGGNTINGSRCYGECGYYGVYLDYSDDGSNNNTVRNCVLTGFDDGILIYYSSNNTVTNVTAKLNGVGLYIVEGNRTNLTNVIAEDNEWYDIALNFWGGDTVCTTIIDNATGYGGRPIRYLNSSTSLSNEIVAELILCDADNSNITNVTVIGSTTFKNNGVFVTNTENSNFTGINSSYRAEGFGIYSSSNIRVVNSSINSNLRTGLAIYSSFGNIITNVTIKDNEGSGIYLFTSYDNALENVITEENSGDFDIYATDNSHCNNILTNVTGYGGRSVRFYNSSAGVSNETVSTLVLCNADNINLENITVIGSTSLKNNGIKIHFTENAALSMINSSSREYGLWMGSSSNNTITNLIANNNSYSGAVTLSESSVNRLANVAANYNEGDCGYYYSTCIISMNYGSDNNMLTNITASFNSGTGICISSSNNTLTNITANSNCQGIRIYDGWPSGSIYNTIKNSRIENNTEYGISLSSYSWGYARYNTFYNNLINATSNYIVPLTSCSGTITCGLGVSTICGLWEEYGYYESYEACCLDYSCTWSGSGCEGETTYGCQNLGCPLGLSECSYTYEYVQNYWNTTLNCTAGPNIIGGPCIGGNFWTTPSGNGFSDVCNDTNENYICDETYTPLTNNTDYLALWRCKESWTCGDWSQCVAGAQNRTCTDRRSCGTIYSRPSLTQSCVMPGGPGGSGGSSTTVTEEKKTWSVIKPDEGAKMTIDKKEIGLTEITIAVNNQVGSTTIQVSKVENRPAEVSKPSENVYQYVQIKKNIEDEQIKESKIKFKVEKKWLTDNNINKFTVKLNRYNNGWNNLTTRMLSDDDNYVYYESESPGFSLFAITGNIVVCEAGQKRCLENEIQACDGEEWNTTESCTNGCDAQTITCITPAPSCTSGEIRCMDKRIEVCANGVWNTQQICEHGCVGAACIVSSNKEEHDFLIYAAIFLIAAVLVFVYVKMTAEKMEKEMFIKPQKK